MLQWTMVFHIIGLAFWLGSLLTVTHILAIHTQEPSPEVRKTLGRVETKLFNGLVHPGAALMIVTGIIMILMNRRYYLQAAWLHAKLVLVAVLVVLDLMVYRRARAFIAGEKNLRKGQCMAWHGAIALVFTGILILVILKPF
jgi:putative membrane protein